MNIPANPRFLYILLLQKNPVTQLCCNHRTNNRKLCSIASKFEILYKHPFRMPCMLFAHAEFKKRGPPRGFGDSGRRAICFQGFGEKGHLFSGIWGESRVLGSRGLRKNILESWGERSVFFQGAKTPPPRGEPQKKM